MCSAAGASGRPGIRMMSPQIGIRNPAPAAISISRTVSVKPSGRPSSAACSENEYWVLAMQIGRWDRPSSAIVFRSVRALAASATSPAPYSPRAIASILASTVASSG